MGKNGHTGGTLKGPGILSEVTIDTSKAQREFDRFLNKLEKSKKELTIDLGISALKDAKAIYNAAAQEMMRFGKTDIFYRLTQTLEDAEKRVGNMAVMLNGVEVKGLAKILDTFSDADFDSITKIDFGLPSLKNNILEAKQLAEVTKEIAEHEEQYGKSRKKNAGIKGTTDELRKQLAAVKRQAESVANLNLRFGVDVTDIEKVEEATDTLERWAEQLVGCQDKLNELKASGAEGMEETFAEVDRIVKNTLESIKARITKISESLSTKTTPSVDISHDINENVKKLREQTEETRKLRKEQENLAKTQEKIVEQPKAQNQSAKQPKLLEHVETLEYKAQEEGMLQEQRTAAQKRKEAEQLLKEEFKFYQLRKKAFDSGTGQADGHIFPDDSYEDIIRAGNALEAYFALYEKYGGTADKLGKKLREFGELNGFIGSYQYAVDEYNAQLAAAEETTPVIERQTVATKAQTAAVEERIVSEKRLVSVLSELQKISNDAGNAYREQESIRNTLEKKKANALNSGSSETKEVFGNKPFYNIKYIEEIEKAISKVEKKFDKGVLTNSTRDNVLRILEEYDKAMYHLNHYEPLMADFSTSDMRDDFLKEFRRRYSEFGYLLDLNFNGKKIDTYTDGMFADREESMKGAIETIKSKFATLRAEAADGSIQLVDYFGEMRKHIQNIKSQIEECNQSMYKSIDLVSGTSTLFKMVLGKPLDGFEKVSDYVYEYLTGIGLISGKDDLILRPSEPVKLNRDIKIDDLYHGFPAVSENDIVFSIKEETKAIDEQAKTVENFNETKKSIWDRQDRLIAQYNAIGNELTSLEQKYNRILGLVGEWYHLNQRLSQIDGKNSADIRKQVLSELSSVPEELSFLIGDSFVEGMKNGFKGIKTKDILSMVSSISNKNQNDITANAMRDLESLDLKSVDKHVLSDFDWMYGSSFKPFAEIYDVLRKISKHRGYYEKLNNKIMASQWDLFDAMGRETAHKNSLIPPEELARIEAARKASIELAKARKAEREEANKFKLADTEEGLYKQLEALADARDWSDETVASRIIDYEEFNQYLQVLDALIAKAENVGEAFRILNSIFSAPKSELDEVATKFFTFDLAERLVGTALNDIDSLVENTLKSGFITTADKSICEYIAQKIIGDSTVIQEKKAELEAQLKETEEVAKYYEILLAQRENYLFDSGWYELKENQRLTTNDDPIYAQISAEVDKAWDIASQINNQLSGIDEVTVRLMPVATDDFKGALENDILSRLGEPVQVPAKLTFDVNTEYQAKENTKLISSYEGLAEAVEKYVSSSRKLWEAYDKGEDYENWKVFADERQEAIESITSLFPESGLDEPMYLRSGVSMKLQDSQMSRSYAIMGAENALRNIELDLRVTEKMLEEVESKKLKFADGTLLDEKEIAVVRKYCEVLRKQMGEAYDEAMALKGALDLVFDLKQGNVANLMGRFHNGNKASNAVLKMWTGYDVNNQQNRDAALRSVNPTAYDQVISDQRAAAEAAAAELANQKSNFQKQWDELVTAMIGGDAFADETDLVKGKILKSLSQYGVTAAEAIDEINKAWLKGELEGKSFKNKWVEAYVDRLNEKSEIHASNRDAKAGDLDVDYLFGGSDKLTEEKAKSLRDEAAAWDEVIVKKKEYYGITSGTSVKEETSFVGQNIIPEQVVTQEPIQIPVDTVVEPGEVQQEISDSLGGKEVKVPVTPEVKHPELSDGDDGEGIVDEMAKLKRAEILPKSVTNALAALRNAKDNKTDLIDLTGVDTVEKLEQRLHNMAQKAIGSELSVDSVVVQDDIARITMYNEALGLTVSQMYQLRYATKDAAEATDGVKKATLEYISGTEKHSPRKAKAYAEAQEKQAQKEQEAIDRDNKWLTSQLSRLNTQERAYKYSGKKIDGTTALEGVENVSLSGDVDQTIDNLAAHIKSRIIESMDQTLDGSVRNAILNDLRVLENSIKIGQYKKYASTTMTPTEIGSARKEFEYMLDSLEAKAKSKNVFDQISESIAEMRKRVTDESFKGYIKDATGVNKFVNDWRVLKKQYSAEVDKENQAAKEQRDYEKAIKKQKEYYEARKKYAKFAMQGDLTSSGALAARREVEELKKEYNDSKAAVTDESKQASIEKQRLALNKELLTVIKEQRAIKAKKAEAEEAKRLKEEQGNYQRAIDLQKKLYEAKKKYAEFEVTGDTTSSKALKAKRDVDGAQAKFDEAKKLVENKKLLGKIEAAKAKLDTELQTVRDEHVKTKQDKEAKQEIDLLNKTLTLQEKLYEAKKKYAKFEAVGDTTSSGALAAKRELDDAQEQFNKYKAQIKKNEDLQKLVEAENKLKDELSAVSKEKKAAKTEKDEAEEYSNYEKALKIQEQIYNERKKLAKIAVNGDLTSSDALATQRRISDAQAELAAVEKLITNEEYLADLARQRTDLGKELSAVTQEQINQKNEKASEEAAKQEAQNIKQIYDSILNTVNKINSLDSDILGLKGKNETGEYTDLINKLQAERDRLIQDVKSTLSQAGSEYGDGLLGADVFLGSARFFDDADTANLTAFMQNASVQAALASGDINKLTECVHKLNAAFTSSEKVGIEAASKIRESLREVSEIGDNLFSYDEATGYVTGAKDGVDASNPLFAKSQQAYNALKFAREQLVGDKPEADWTADEARMIQALIDNYMQYAKALDDAVQKEQKYFEGKSRYVDGGNMHTGSLVPKSEADKDTVDEEIKKYNELVAAAKKYAGEGALITNFTQGADGIAKLDFSVFDEATGSLRNFRMEMGSVTEGIYVAETTINKSLSNLQAAQKQFQSAGNLLDRLRAADIDTNMDTAAEPIKRLLELQQLLHAEMAKGSGADSGEMARLTKDSKLAAAEIEKMYRQYINMQNAIADGKATDMGQINKNGDIYTQLSAKVQDYAAMQTKAQLAIGGFNEKTNTLKFTLTDVNGQVESFTASMEGLSGTVGIQSTGINRLTSSYDRFKADLAGIGKQLMTATVGYNVFYKAISMLRTGVGYVKEIDLAMTELRKVTDATEASYDRFLSTAADTAGEIGSTVSDFTNATANFARLGYSIDESADMAKSAIIYKNVADGLDTVDEATDSIISTMKAFGIEADDTMGIIDKFNAVGNSFAITSAGIGDAMQRSASALKEGGNTIDESIALITAANSVIQNPEQVGTALKTLSLRIRGVKTELTEAGLETEGMAETTAQLQAKLKALTHGKVDIMLDADTFKNTTQILREMAGVWEEMTDMERAAALELIGGKRQAKRKNCLNVQKCA